MDSEHEKCPRTGKPKRVCCVGHPNRDMTLRDVMTYDQPLPQVVIDVALLNGLDPHVVMDDVEDRGWETHDRGFDDQVRIAAQRLAEEARS